MDLQRMSLDLMGDPDIQNIFQKSYSLEDLGLVDEEGEEAAEVEDALDCLDAVVGGGGS